MSIPQLLNKVPAIFITNSCNLNCGACLSFCGHYPESKIFDITIDELEESLKFCEKHQKRRVHLYGGEPTIHLDWDNLVSYLKTSWSSFQFHVFTNGRTLQGLEEGYFSFARIERASSEFGKRKGVHNSKQEKRMYELPGLLNLECKCGSVNFEWTGYGPYFQGEEDECRANYYYKCSVCAAEHLLTLPKGLERSFDTQQNGLVYRVDPKTEDTIRPVFPLGIAPKDMRIGGGYYELAKKNCYLLKRCESVIFKGKLYACFIAACLDWILNEGENGWELTDLHKSEPEIKAQLKNFCSSCGYCLGSRQELEYWTGIKQLTSDKTFVTNALFNILPEKRNLHNVDRYI